MRPKVSMREALADPALLGGVLAGDSWRPWRVMLMAMFGERLDPDELQTFRLQTARYAPPERRVDEALFAIGRRGGKDRAASVAATYMAGLCEHPALVPGERGVMLCIGPDQRQSGVTLNYVAACFEQSPILAQMITGRTADRISLNNGVDVEVRAANYRRLRGMTAVGVIGTEVAFWMDGETSANPDVEILGAVRPALATTGGPLIQISSPYARRGEFWSTYKRHYGPDGDPAILVVRGTSRDFNPTLSQAIVDRALERDRAAASAEYLAEFRSDIEAFLSVEAIEAAWSTAYSSDSM